MVESGRVSGKGRIRARTKKAVPASTGKGSNLYEYRKMVEYGRVPGKGRIRVSTGKESNLCEYRKMVEYGRVPGKVRIRASIEKLFLQAPEKGSNLFKYRKR